MRFKVAQSTSSFEGLTCSVYEVVSIDTVSIVTDDLGRSTSSLALLSERSGVVSRSVSICFSPRTTEITSLWNCASGSCASEVVARRSRKQTNQWLEVPPDRFEVESKLKREVRMVWTQEVIGNDRLI